MSEDKDKNKEKETVDEKEKRIEELEAKYAALELGKQQSDDDLYSEEYLEFKRNKNKQKKVEQGGFSTGSRMSDFDADQLKDMELPKLVELIAKEVYINIREEQDMKEESTSLKKQKEIREAKREEAVKFATTHPDLKKYIAEIAKLEKKNPNLNVAQLYRLAKEDEPEKKGESKPELQPNTRDEITSGVKKSDENLSYREIIRQEYDKLKK